MDSDFLVSWFKSYGLEEVKQMYTDNNLVYLERDQNYVKSLSTVKI